DGEWQQAQGSGAWAYAWDVPDSAGSYTLRTRAVDVVGNVQSPVSVYTVEVDSTPPAVSADAEYQSNPFVPVQRNATGRWAVPLSGVASDVGAGVRAVSVSLAPNSGGWQPAVLE